jgi:hypothetical protein
MTEAVLLGIRFVEEAFLYEDALSRRLFCMKMLCRVDAKVQGATVE